ncbi:hypothetical protein [Falsiroseomonas tokyonensis]|nr:hypothetical protein [Falsiroseomonas tokyonensis]
MKLLPVPAVCAAQAGNMAGLPTVGNLAGRARGRPYAIDGDLRPPQAGERPDGRRAQWRVAERSAGD